jgi:hypothetical protein
MRKKRKIEFTLRHPRTRARNAIIGKNLYIVPSTGKWRFLTLPPDDNIGEVRPEPE